MAAKSNKKGPGRDRLDPGSETVPINIKLPKSLLDEVDAAFSNRSEAVREALARYLVFTKRQRVQKPTTQSPLEEGSE